MHYIAKDHEADDGTQLKAWVPATVTWADDLTSVRVYFKGFIDQNAAEAEKRSVGGLQADVDLSKIREFKPILDRIADAIIKSTGFTNEAKPLKITGITGSFYKKAVETGHGVDATVWKEDYKILNLLKESVHIGFKGYKDEAAVKADKDPLASSGKWTVKGEGITAGAQADRFIKQMLIAISKDKKSLMYGGSVRVF